MTANSYSAPAPLLDYPNEISIKFPGVSSPGSTYNVQMYTLLFRNGAHLPEALGLVRERTSEDELEVYSVACSTGAEADSFLALTSRILPDTRVTMTGIDINHAALNEANKGRYLVHSGVDRLETEGIEATLTEFGFELGDTITGSELPEEYRNSDCYDNPDAIFRVASSCGIRSRHNVSFEFGDVTKPFAKASKAHLVMANNLFYYLHLMIEIKPHLIWLRCCQKTG